MSRRVMLALAAGALLAGCGQTGALFLPGEPPAAETEEPTEPAGPAETPDDDNATTEDDDEEAAAG